MAFKVIEQSVLKANSSAAGKVRKMLASQRVFMINIISSPGSGKTLFLEKVGLLLQKEGVKFDILTGDCFTTRDAERIDAAGLPVVQINTGGACHIDAQLVDKALREVDLEGKDLVIVENVGNLVCPAGFDIGEDVKIAFFSTAEGHDKPMKYPMLVKESELAIINKIDLIAHVDFDMSFWEKCVRDVNPGLKVLKMSAKTGEGVEEFVKWIKRKIKSKAQREGKA